VTKGQLFVNCLSGFRRGENIDEWKAIDPRAQRAGHRGGAVAQPIRLEDHRAQSEHVPRRRAVYFLRSCASTPLLRVATERRPLTAAPISAKQARTRARRIGEG